MTVTMPVAAAALGVLFTGIASWLVATNVERQRQRGAAQLEDLKQQHALRGPKNRLVSLCDDVLLILLEYLATSRGDPKLLDERLKLLEAALTEDAVLSALHYEQVERLRYAISASRSALSHWTELESRIDAACERADGDPADYLRYLDEIGSGRLRQSERFRDPIREFRVVMSSLGSNVSHRIGWAQSRYEVRKDEEEVGYKQRHMLVEPPPI